MLQVKSWSEKVSPSGSYSIGCLPVEISTSEDPNGLEVNAVLLRAGSEMVLFLS